MTGVPLHHLVATSKKSSFLLLWPARRAWPLVGLALALAGCGKVGPQGPTGPQGPPGATGLPGPKGATGQDGFETLVNAVPLPRGDAHCPFGGTRYDTGLDNGDGGGTARDGVLQPGEVDTTSYVCNPPGTASADVSPPTSPSGTSSIQGWGGDGTTNGGSGGNMNIDQGVATGGNVVLFRNGTVDTSFTVPGTDHVNLGVNPLDVPAGQTVTPKVIGAGQEDTLVDGDLYRYQDNNDGVSQPEDTDEHLYQWSVANGPQMITGIHIESGGTLVLPYAVSNLPYYVSSGRVAVPDDIDNAGTLSAALSGQTRLGLYVWAQHYYGEPGSIIDQSGADATAGGLDGGGGGSLYLFAVSDPEAHSTSCSGDSYLGGVFNQGTIDTRRGTDASTPPSDASGAVTLCAAVDLYNSGSIDASGQPSSPYGGAGGSVTLVSEFGRLYNAGAIDVSGGDGASAGGAGGVTIVARAIVNSGDLDASGGGVLAGSDCSTVGGTCSASGGTYVQIAARGGPLANSGAVRVNGGDAASGNAGYGGGLYVTAASAADSVTSAALPAGPIAWTGDIDFSGGTGDQGGGGGYVGIGLNSSVPSSGGQGIALYGYTQVDLHGGSGQNGGNGGYFFMGCTPYLYPSSNPQNATGAVYDEVPLDTSGGAGVGDSSDTYGGSGGAFQLLSSDQYGSPYAVVVSAETVNAAGGDGTHGGRGGGIYLTASGVDFEGDVDTHGGAGDPDVGDSGGGGIVSLRAAYGMISATGNIDGQGGDAYAGGGGASVFMDASRVDVAGSIDTTGGSGNSASGSTGGNGGNITLWSTDKDTAVAGTLANDGGGGETPGLPGTLEVDGFPWQ